MPLNDDVNKLLADTGVDAPGGGLKANVDALCTVTGLPFTTLKQTVDGLVLLVGWADDVMPKCASELGLTLTGKLADDAKALRENAGVEKDSLATELTGVCQTLGVTSDKLQQLLAVMPTLMVPKTPKVKIVEAPCVCAKGVEQCRGCKAEEHPCVCKSILIKGIDQPIQLCKAKVHECLCEHSVSLSFSYNPGIPGVNLAKMYENLPPGTHTGYLTGVPSFCRQHPDVVDVDDSDDDESKPAKKKVKKERRGKK